MKGEKILCRLVGKKWGRSCEVVGLSKAFLSLVVRFMCKLFAKENELTGIYQIIYTGSRRDGISTIAQARCRTTTCPIKSAKAGVLQK